MGPTPEQVGRSRSQTWSRGFWSTARWSGTVKQRYFSGRKGIDAPASIPFLRNQKQVPPRAQKKSNTRNHTWHRGTQRKLKELQKSKAKAEEKAGRETPEATK